MKYRIPEQRYIGRVGIELEGGWIASRGITPYYDGSVTVRNSLGLGSDECLMDHQRITRESDGIRVIHHCSNIRCYDCNQRRRPAPPNGYPPSPSQEQMIVAGEICSQPLAVSGAINWLESNYPDQMNNSCGLHVHTSFPNQGHYGMLMGTDFRKRFRTQYEAWAYENIPASKEPLFWSRWNGQNQYCLDQWKPDKQVLFTNKGEDRYTFLNFAWGCDLRGTGKRKTVELRVLPVFTDKTVAAAAVSRYLGIIEDYIGNYQVEEAVEATVIDDYSGDEVIVCA